MVSKQWELTCSLTAVLSPNTKYPPNRPAINVSVFLSFPPFAFFCISKKVLYSETNFARFNACCFVARYMVLARFFQLEHDNAL